MTDAEKIAAKLTEAQRDMLSGHVRWSHGNRILCQGTWRSGEALERRGLTINIRTLTPLGLEVRKVLEREASK